MSHIIDEDFVSCYLSFFTKAVWGAETSSKVVLFVWKPGGV